MDGDTVTDFAHEVKACALGQASSSIMARHIVGAKASELRSCAKTFAKCSRKTAPPGKRQMGRHRRPRAGPRLQSTPCLDAADLRRRGRRHRPDRGQACERESRQSGGGVNLSPAADSFRHAPRLLGRGLVKIYRYTLSPLIGFECRHLPTCSDYADQALDRYGLWAGGWMTLARLLRCQPFGTSGLDFVPDAVSADARWCLPWRYARWRGTTQKRLRSKPPAPDQLATGLRCGCGCFFAAALR